MLNIKQIFAVLAFNLLLIPAYGQGRLAQPTHQDHRALPGRWRVGPDRAHHGQGDR